MRKLAKVCEYCEKAYLQPCGTVGRRDQCPNWQHLKEVKPKGRVKPKRKK